VNNRVFSKTVTSPQATYILNTFIFRLGRQVSDRHNRTSCSSCSCCCQFSKCSAVLWSSGIPSLVTTSVVLVSLVALVVIKNKSQLSNVNITTEHTIAIDIMPAHLYKNNR